MIDKYEVKLKLIRDMLGTNPCDPNVMDTHILDRQRKLILEKSKVNSEINKYLDALPPSKERGEEEINLLIAKLEEFKGEALTPEERLCVMAGDLEKMRETFAELDMKGTTVFFWNPKENRPCIGDHMIYGFLKAAAEAIGRTLTKKNGTVLHSTSFTQSLINQHLRCEEAFITFDRDIKRNAEGTPIYKQRSLRAMTAQGPRISLAKSEIVEAGAELKFTLKVLKDSPIEQSHLERLFSYGEISGLGQWRNAGHGQFTFELMKR